MAGRNGQQFLPTPIVASGTASMKVIDDIVNTKTFSEVIIW